ncbi:hypothetical protein AAVH_18484 [Aphelenchoides avenae]|nr:hypothetical protein AAVH_18484 [Aphelenchus avenae]
MNHGFDGCEDNKCLPFFAARYASDATDKLKISLGKYTLILGIIQSICTLFPLKDQVRKDDMRLKMVGVVRSLKDIVSQLSNVSSEADHYKPCAADFPAWTAEVEQVATYVVNAAAGSLNASSWEDRQRLHELVANGTVTGLSHSKYRDGYYFKALAYLPFTDDGQHAFMRLPVGAEDVIRNESKLVKYVVSRFPKRAVQSLALIRSKWGTIEKKGNETLDAIFSTSASNLSKRIEEVENRFKKDIDGGAFLSVGGFRALVALRCGYEFVWYELGYRYFPAGFATGDYVLAPEQGSKYSSNCGQIVFFL